ncbi:MAG: hypothetical protein JST51_12140 [Armatimonadetes bacterium]|nr:hypothetical protein [Armatimonadota bacterium]
MKRRNYRPRMQHGQTLIIALLVLFVLLILGAAFASILSRTIRGASNAKARGVNSDFAESGVRYAQSQLVNSDLGADWRGQATPLTQLVPDTTRDPDAYYLRPPATAGGVPLNFPGTTRIDNGGPDGLGPFFRIDYKGGRALVRVTYAPGDQSIFSSSGVGTFYDPGLARNYLKIESIGRQGEVNANDPTTAAANATVQFQNFADQAGFDAAYAKMKDYDGKETSSRKLLALAQIGLIDYARFETNKYKSTHPIEMGFATDSGAMYRETPGADGTPVDAPRQVGDTQDAYNLSPTGAGAAIMGLPSGGSMRVNGDLRVYGPMIADLNQTMGDGIEASGAIQSASGGTLTVNKSWWDRTTNSWQVTSANMVLDSYNPAFSTFGGVFRDGLSDADGSNDVRGVGYLTPASMLSSADVAESANTNRYLKLTKDSGILGPSGNTGLFGHGEGPYVDNSSDYQVPDDEQGRRIAGGTSSLVQDWLSSFGDASSSSNFRTGWHGPFYIPVGAFLLLTKDGFVIQRNAHPDQEPEERTWKRADGTDSGLTSMRYRVGYGNDGRIHIINTLTQGMSASINDALTPSDFSLGPVFNGVVYFEGNVRVRGVIPTDVQMTVVSNKTVYIEGSILKGVQANDVTAAYPAVITNNRLTRPSRSALMLMAKDYVTLNPTMFVGPSSETNAQVEQGGIGINGYSPDHLSSPDGETNLQVDFPLSDRDPANSNNTLPYQNWLPAPLSYKEFNPANPADANGTGVTESTNLLLTQALEYSNPGPSNSFFNIKVNRGSQLFGGNDQYQFEVLNSVTNSAKLIWAAINNPAPPPAFGDIYGLGTEVFQQSPKFESVAFPLVDPTAATASIVNNRFLNTFNTNNYEMLIQGSNSVSLGLTQFGTQASGNYLLARAAAVPLDVKIEASIFAEEGSFFVIPGDWYNMDPNDRRDTFENEVAKLMSGGASLVDARNQAAKDRLEKYGNMPNAPFYGEPIDVRIDIVGSIAENLPPPISVQNEWLKKWGWIPTKQAGTFDGSTGNPHYIPYSHVSAWTKANPAARPYTSNLTISYDPTLATGRVGGVFGFDSTVTAANPANPNAMIRTSTVNGVTYQLPPMPRLPVSPTLAYFGESK